MSLTEKIVSLFVRPRAPRPLTARPIPFPVQPAGTDPLVNSEQSLGARASLIGSHEPRLAERASLISGR